MNAKIEKAILMTAGLVLGLTGLASGIVVLTGWRFPLDWLQGYSLSAGYGVSPVPALALTTIIGGGALLVAWLVHTGHPLALTVSAACGAGIIVYELAGMMVVPFGWVQPLYIGIGEDEGRLRPCELRNLRLEVPTPGVL